MLDLRSSVAFGVILRNMHRWAAHAMVACVFLHMCRVFFTGSYKPPREFNWVMGVALFLLTLFLELYRLPAALGSVGLLGDHRGHLDCGLCAVDRQGPEVHAAGRCDRGPGGAAALLRAACGGAAAGSDALCGACTSGASARTADWPSLSRPVRLRSAATVSVDVEEPVLVAAAERRAGSRAGPPLRHSGTGARPADQGRASLRRTRSSVGRICSIAELFVLLLTIAGVMAVSIFFNAPLEQPVNVMHPPNPAKAPWYFLGLQEQVSYSAFWGGIGVPGIELLLLLLVAVYRPGQGGSGTVVCARAFSGELPLPDLCDCRTSS